MSLYQIFFVSRSIHLKNRLLLISVSCSSGVIRVKRPLALQLRAYNLTVAAADGNVLTSDAIAVVMVAIYNQSAELRPAFTSPLFAFSVLENATRGSIVGVVGSTVQRGRFCMEQL